MAKGSSANIKKSTVRLAFMAMLAAMAIVVGLWKFPIFPAAPYLEFDFADVLIHITTLIFGPIAGLCVLFIVSVIQAFLLGGNGIIGLVMHFVASGSVVVILGCICGKDKGMKRLILALVLGTIAQTLIMIPMNYIFTPMVTGAPREMVVDLLVPVLIPFNLIKAGICCICTGIIYKVMSHIISRIQKDVN